MYPCLGLDNIVDVVTVIVYVDKSGQHWSFFS